MEQQWVKKELYEELRLKYETLLEKIKENNKPENLARILSERNEIVQKPYGVEFHPKTPDECHNSTPDFITDDYKDKMIAIAKDSKPKIIDSMMNMLFEASKEEMGKPASINEKGEAFFYEQPQKSVTLTLSPEQHITATKEKKVSVIKDKVANKPIQEKPKELAEWEIRRNKKLGIK